LRKDLKKLKLEDITVDVESAELMMHEEMALLRGAIKGGAASVASAVDDASAGGASSARVKALESENANLRGLLKELKAELNSGKQRPGSRSASPVNGDAASASASGAEVLELQKELKAKNDIIASQAAELDTLQAAMASNASASSSAAAQTEASRKKIDELKARNAELQGQLDEIGKKATADKDELMEAMAQEMEVSLTCSVQRVCTVTIC
jgi:chromosome segregation ATPase